MITLLGIYPKISKTLIQKARWLEVNAFVGLSLSFSSCKKEIELADLSSRYKTQLKLLRILFHGEEAHRS